MAIRVAGEHRSGHRLTEILDVRRMIFARVCKEVNQEDRIYINAYKNHPSNHRLTVSRWLDRCF